MADQAMDAIRSLARPPDFDGSFCRAPSTHRDQQHRGSLWPKTGPCAPARLTQPHCECPTVSHRGRVCAHPRRPPMMRPQEQRWRDRRGDECCTSAGNRRRRGDPLEVRCIAPPLHLLHLHRRRDAACDGWCCMATEYEEWRPACRPVPYFAPHRHQRPPLHHARHEGGDGLRAPTGAGCRRHLRGFGRRELPACCRVGAGCQPPAPPPFLTASAPVAPAPGGGGRGVRRRRR